MLTMDDAELNSLVSPCKRLKLLSPGKPTGPEDTERLTSEPADDGKAEQLTANGSASEQDLSIISEASVDNDIIYIDEETDCEEKVVKDEKETGSQETAVKVAEATNDITDMGNDEDSEITKEESESVSVDNQGVAHTITEHVNDSNSNEETQGGEACHDMSQDRMFCVTGEPVHSAEREVAIGADATESLAEETASSEQEHHVKTIDTIEDIEVKNVQEGKGIGLVMLETDLDATLTNDNIESFGHEEDGKESCETEDQAKQESVPDNDIEVSDDPCPRYPIEPAVTVLPVSIKKWLNENSDSQVENYPVMTTFKPQQDRPKPVIVRPDIIDGSDSCHTNKNTNSSYPNNKGSNSEPLLTSTPIVKLSQGLKMRDMNIMRTDTDNDIKVMKPPRNIQDLYEAEKVETNVYCGENERDIVNVKNAINTVQGNKKVDRKESLRRDRESTREKRKMKGTRIQKFKEYIGPGLTSNLSKDSEPNTTDPDKKDFVRNTDIQTCTLTEYKGFGLTGPLPNKPLLASTPLPSSSNINPNAHRPENAGLAGTGLLNSAGVNNIRDRPAGTEGMLLANYESKPQIQPSVIAPNVSGGYAAAKETVQAKNNQSGPKNNQSGSKSNNSGSSVQFMMKGSCSSGQRSLTDHSAQCNSGASSALQPDEVYPSNSSSHDDRSDNRSDNRSENNSNTDKSDKSDKWFDPKVLQCSGQLKLSAYMNFGLLTVHVVQARQLSTKWKPSCDSFVKMCLIPDDGKKPKCKTDIIHDSNNPLYDEKFSFELTDEDHSKRLMISVWHRDQSASVNEFLGCMSFGLRHLTNPRKEVSGWYYLLTEDVGRRKHLQVSHRQRPQLKVRANHSNNIPSVNKDVWGTESVQLTVQRGKNGFGFSVIEACPVRVGRVDGTSPAESAGLQPGDIIVRLNRQNVSRSTATSVAKLIKHSSNTLLLELHRHKPVTLEHVENNSFWEIPASQPDGFYDNPADPYHYDDDTENMTVPHMFTLHDNMKENAFPGGDMTVCSLNPNIASLATSTPLPLLARGHRTVQTCEVRKQEAIHRLLSLELDFIDLMHCGMQRYSRPLRHCILSHSQHMALFQNIEKLTTISEYHVKQMHDNAPSSFMSEDTDTSASSESHNFVLSIGLIYRSKVHMLCQAYDLYAKGIARANQILSELRHNPDFLKFLQEAPAHESQPSISAFIYRPVQHLRELYKAVQEIFLNTSSDSADYNSLKQVVEGLQECANTITNYSNCCERVESMSSLTSRDSKTTTTSFSSSMKSRSSSSSAASSCSRGQGHGPSCSLQGSVKSADAEVMKIQDKLVFSSNVPVFQLCQDDRHLIFSGEMFTWAGHQWSKTHLFLFSDLLLQTVRENDGYLRVTHEPIMLKDVVAMDAQRHHGTEMILYIKNGQSGKQKCSVRAPSTEQKYAWKSLIEQRVFAVRGSLEYYSSTSDISSSSASAIVI